MSLGAWHLIRAVSPAAHDQTVLVPARHGGCEWRQNVAL
jgi:hypothetical protein